MIFLMLLDGLRGDYIYVIHAWLVAGCSGLVMPFVSMDVAKAMAGYDALLSRSHDDG